MSAPKRIRLEGIKQFQYNQFTKTAPPIDWNKYRWVNGIDLEIPPEIANRRAALEEHERDAKRKAVEAMNAEQKDAFKNETIKLLKNDISKMEGKYFLVLIFNLF